MCGASALGLAAALLPAVSGTAETPGWAAPRTALNSVLSEVRPDGTVPDAFGPHLVALKTPPAGPYLAVLKNDESDIASHIGHPLGIPMSVVVNSKQVVPTALAYTYAYDSKGDLTGRPASCVIYINPLLYHSIDASQVNVTLMHEMFHCFEAIDYPTLTAFYDAPKRLIEGSAERVGETSTRAPPVLPQQLHGFDFTGMAPVGELVFSGQGHFTASYSQSTTATSGPISLTEIPSNDRWCPDFHCPKVPRECPGSALVAWFRRLPVRRHGTGSFVTHAGSWYRTGH
jgi:hypothetical protein